MTARARWTRQEVTDALNDGVALIKAEPLFDTEYSVTIKLASLLDLLVNTAVTLLDTPDATLNDVIETCYSEEPDTVKGWAGLLDD